MPHSPESSDKEDLLALLQSHGQSFLASFGSLPDTQPKRKRRKLDDATHANMDRAEKEGKDENSNDEWNGFDSEETVSLDGSDTYLDDSEDVSEEGADDIGDDEFSSEQPTKKQPQVVVFSAPSQSERPRMSKLQAKSFMSSKVSKLRENIADTAKAEGEADDDEEEYEEERSNIQNDALLHKLLHTQLLSGSRNEELNLTPAQRRKALEGRVLELAAGAKLGKGESSVTKEERRKNSKSVRMGLERKVVERRTKALEEAKNLGNYHHSIKHLFEADADEQPGEKKRDRGLKMGIGKFTGGILKLSKDEIASVQNSGRPTRGGIRGGITGGGRGGGRGRGRGSNSGSRGSGGRGRGSRGR